MDTATLLLNPLKATMNLQVRACVAASCCAAAVASARGDERWGGSSPSSGRRVAPQPKTASTYLRVVSWALKGSDVWALNLYGVYKGKIRAI